MYVRDGIFYIRDIFVQFFIVLALVSIRSAVEFGARDLRYPGTPLVDSTERSAACPFFYSRNRADFNIVTAVHACSISGYIARARALSLYSISVL